MMMPSIFRENLFDDFMNDFAFPAFPNVDKELYGKENAHKKRQSAKAHGRRRGRNHKNKLSSHGTDKNYSMHSRHSKHEPVKVVKTTSRSKKRHFVIRQK